MVVAIVLDFGEQQSTKWLEVECKLQGLGLLCTMFVLVLFSGILEICLTIVTLRGSILNDGPRHGVPYLLYSRLCKFPSKYYDHFSESYCTCIYVFSTLNYVEVKVPSRFELNAKCNLVQ